VRIRARVRQARVAGLGELAIDRRFDGVPQNVGDQQNDDRSQHAVGETGKPCVLLVEMGEIDTPAPSQHRSSANDQQRPDTAFDARGCYAWRTAVRVR
jgi:hypothetical protein